MKTILIFFCSLFQTQISRNWQNINALHHPSPPPALQCLPPFSPLLNSLLPPLTMRLVLSSCFPGLNSRYLALKPRTMSNDAVNGDDHDFVQDRKNEFGKLRVNYESTLGKDRPKKNLSSFRTKDWVANDTLAKVYDASDDENRIVKDSEFGKVRPCSLKVPQASPEPDTISNFSTCSTDLDENEIRRQLLADKWRQLFDKVSSTVPKKMWVWAVLVEIEVVTSIF